MFPVNLGFCQKAAFKDIESYIWTQGGRPHKSDLVIAVHYH